MSLLFNRISTTLKSIERNLLSLLWNNSRYPPPGNMQKINKFTFNNYVRVFSVNQTRKKLNHTSTYAKFKNNKMP